MRHFIAKAIIASVLIFAGVGGGVYIGTALSNRATPLGITPDLLSNRSYLKIDDSFPDYQLTEYRTNTETSISLLSEQGPTLLFFLSSSCDACYHLASYVRTAVIRNLQNDIQVVLIFDENALTSDDSYPDSLIIPGARIFTTDRANQNLEDGINVMPSVVGLDRENKIKFIMSGYNRKINADFINEFI